TWDIIVFSLTLAAPETEYNYYLDLWNPGIDLLAGLIYFEYSTYFGNTTVRLALNDSWLGSAVGEGFSSWSFIPDYGFLNFSIYIYQGEEVWDYLEIGITNVEPDINTFELLYEKFSENDFYCFYSYFTNWGNTTAYVYENSTLISTLDEFTSLSWERNLAYDTYVNVTVDIVTNNFNLTLEYGYYNAPSTINVYLVDIDLFDQFGLGLTFTTVKFYMNYINDSYRLPENFITTETNFTIYVTDYFNVTLKTVEVYLTDSTKTNYVDISIIYYLAEFVNPYNFYVLVEVTRNGVSHPGFNIAGNTTYHFWLTSGSYNLTCSPTYNKQYNSYFHEWSTTSQLKRYTIQLEKIPSETKGRINLMQVLMGVVTVGGFVAGGWFFYEKVYFPLKTELEKLSIQNLFRHRKKQSIVSLVFAIIGLIAFILMVTW
ncbi:MAG: hypothetical protein KAU62_14865, partial [Candidatus Heimdallarchaeota archaeon]|nr:hypothetical protein [Candidatus Heimdallarchaeota archaeon]MCK4612434.1 hypothetical protein [Candidatus Heimdallarchaeota archaeon]